jgi:SNF2 family DNA or RNA helicase
LWSVFRGVSPGLFGSWDRFREVFADPIEKARVTERKQALSRVLRPFILRRTKSEVLKELPARTEIQLVAELSDAERRRYEDTRLWAVTHLTDLDLDTGKDQRFQVLAALTKLRQLACHPRLLDDQWDQSSAKLDLFLETVDELREGKHRALVFSQFTSHLAIIREALDKQKITYQYLDGQTPPKQRQERVDAFQRGEGEMFLISLKAGGTGLNLTGADYVIHMDPWWNPAVEDQATDRAHRIGQTRPVTVYRLVAKDTIEEQILKLHADKRTLVAGILDGTDQAAKLSTTELLDLIKTGGRST